MSDTLVMDVQGLCNLIAGYNYLKIKIESVEENGNFTVLVWQAYTGLCNRDQWQKASRELLVYAVQNGWNVSPHASKNELTITNKKPS